MDRIDSVELAAAIFVDADRVHPSEDDSMVLGCDLTELCDFGQPALVQLAALPITEYHVAGSVANPRCEIEWRIVRCLRRSLAFRSSASPSTSNHLNHSPKSLRLNLQHHARHLFLLFSETLYVEDSETQR